MYGADDHSTDQPIPSRHDPDRAGACFATANGSVRKLRTWRNLRIGQPWLKIGRQVVYLKSSVEEWLRKNEVAAVGLHGGIVGLHSSLELLLKIEWPKTLPIMKVHIDRSQRSLQRRSATFRMTLP